MKYNPKKMSVPIEFDQFIDDLAFQIAEDTGLPKNKSRAMRLLASTYKGKMIFKGNKFDFKIF